MADAATTSLRRILKDYVRIDAVPLFDLHDEAVSDREASDPHFDWTFVVRDEGTGELVRRFDKKALEALARKGRDRQERTGDLSPIGPGHTIPDRYDPKTGQLLRKTPETEQPPVWGYAGDWRVGPFGPGGTQAVTVNLYVRPEHEAAVRNEYPRRSVELWVGDKLIDWIALLKRCPKRDLGLIAAQRPGFAAHYSTRETSPHYSAERRRGTCLRYAMGEAMPMPPPKPDDLTDAVPGADEMSPEDVDTADKYMRHYEKKHAHIGYAKKCYEASLGGGGAGLAMPSATNGGPPGMPEEEPAPPPPTPEMAEPERMARIQARATHYQRQYQGARSFAQQQESRLQALEQTTRLQRYEREIGELVRAGYRVNAEKALTRCASYSAVQFEEFKADVVENYERDLTRVPDVYQREAPTGPGGGRDDEFTPRHMELAQQYQREHPGKGTGLDEIEAEWAAAEAWARKNYTRNGSR